MKVNNYFNQENAIFAAKVAAGIVVVGGAIAATGYLLESAGTQLLSHMDKSTVISNIAMKNLGRFLQSSGAGLFLVGKYTSYTVLVPGYIVGYEFPKWMMEHGIPKMMTFIQDNIYKPLVQSMEWLKGKVLDVIQYVGEHILRPILEKVGQIVNDYLIQPLLKNMKWLADRVIEMISWATENLFIPMFDALIKVMKLAEKYILEPLGKGIEWIGNRIFDVINWGVHSVVLPLFRTIDAIMQWVGKNFFEPALQAIWRFAGYAADFASKYIFTPLQSAAIWAYENLLQPVADAANAVMRFTFNYFLYPTYQFARDYLVYPTVDFIVKGSNLTYEHIIQPIGQKGYALIANVTEIAGKIYTGARRDIGALFSRVAYN
ncbi:MAG: hypothetical protein K1000chlam3_01196 [Chlamydiae bacterium]|nr:hypothetical protein [Chlamydiota bacterium]